MFYKSFEQIEIFELAKASTTTSCNTQMSKYVYMDNDAFLFSFSIKMIYELRHRNRFELVHAT